MNGQNIKKAAAVISYIEAHLNEKLDLDTVANALCYSKYHLRDTGHPARCVQVSGQLL